jgi:hypothetical protein
MRILPIWCAAHKGHLCALVGLRVIPLVRTLCDLVDLLNSVAFKKCMLQVQQGDSGDIHALQMVGFSYCVPTCVCNLAAQ